MEWKEALSIGNRNGKIDNGIYEALLKLPQIRDEVFFPGYEEYGYIGYDPIYGEYETPTGTSAYLDFHLCSTKANRRIALSYIFRNNDHELGIISDSIVILDAEKGWDIIAHLEMLAKNRGFAELKKDYEIPRYYSGSPEQKLEACLQQIRLNYDTIAPDIISGENWDSHAWNVGDHF